MKRRLIVLAGVIAALAAACGSSVPAIEIGDFSIDRGDLDQLIDDRLAELEEQGIPADNVATMDIVAEYLTEQGRIQLVIQAADEYGIDQPVSTIEDAALVFDEINVLLTAEGVDPATVDLSAVVQCSRHILVASLDEAQSVLDALADGEDFAALAASSSFDPGSAENGGDLGCAGPGQFVPAFEAALLAAEVGEVVGPVETDFGFHVIERLGVPADVAETAAVQAKLREILVTDDVSIDPRYGTWDAESVAVAPPAAPAG